MSISFYDFHLIINGEGSILFVLIQFYSMNYDYPYDYLYDDPYDYSYDYTIGDGSTAI